jgi:hypothetical protein
MGWNEGTNHSPALHERMHDVAERADRGTGQLSIADALHSRLLQEASRRGSRHHEKPPRRPLRARQRRTFE